MNVFMGVTIKDIAEKVNLSVTTVSLVLNNKAHQIPDKTKNLVLKTAKELNYHPNQLAVGLITKKTKTIGLLLPDIRNDFFSSLAKGIEDEARAHGWTIILCNTGDDHERELEYIDLLFSKKVDGILYCMSINTKEDNFMEIKNLLDNYSMPYLLVDRFFKSTQVSTIILDHYKGGYLATKHLLDLGHRSIACITGPSHAEESNQRLEGYKKALIEANIQYDPTLIIEGNYHIESGFSALKKLPADQYSAIFSFNDMMAIGIYKAMKAKGIRIPQDISIIGYDDILYSQILETPLTTIHQPVTRLGYSAVKELIDHLDNQRPLKSIKVSSPSLIVRKSTSKIY
jgi:LacI family transcriptional regulator